MVFLKVIYWAIIFITRLRFPPGIIHVLRKKIKLSKLIKKYNIFIYPACKADGKRTAGPRVIPSAITRLLTPSLAYRIYTELIDLYALKKKYSIHLYHW